jgi:Ran GTPase-activating protein (RanGAP) involved in mRNA processing and transport
MPCCCYSRRRNSAANASQFRRGVQFGPVNDRQLGPAGAHWVARQVSIGELVTVDLSNTAMVGPSQKPNFSGLNFLLKSCTKSKSQLQQLNIALNNLTFGGSDFRGMQSLCDMLQRNGPGPALHTLNLKGNTLHSEGLCCLADALQSNTQLTALSLSGCRMTQNDEGEGITDGIERLAQMLTVNRALTFVNLSKNSIGAYYDLEGNMVENCKNCRTLSEALEGNRSSLTAIDLRSNNLNESQMLSIDAALRSNQSLTNASLSSLAITRVEDSIASALSTDASGAAELTLEVANPIRGDDGGGGVSEEHVKVA